MFVDIMYLHKILPGNTIPVGHNKVVVVRRLYGLVQDLTFLEAVILLPDMDYFIGNLFPHPVNQIPGFIVGSVIGDNQLKILISLAIKSP